MRQYWVNTGGIIKGPYNTSKLKELALTGFVKKNDEVSIDQKKWVIAGKVKGLIFAPSQKIEPTPQENPLLDTLDDELKLEDLLPTQLPKGLATQNASSQNADATTLSGQSPSVSPSLTAGTIARNILANYLKTGLLEIIVLPILGFLVGLLLGFYVSTAMKAEDNGVIVAIAVAGFFAGFGTAVYDAYRRTHHVIRKLGLLMTVEFGKQQIDRLGWSVACSLLCSILLGLSFLLWTTRQGVEMKPTEIPLAEVQRSGLPSNRYVVLTDFVVVGDPIEVTEVKVTTFDVLLYSSESDNGPDLTHVIATASTDKELKDEKLEGNLAPSQGRLRDEVRQRLSAAHPDINFDKCLVLFVGLGPVALIWVLLTLVVGAGLGVLGLVQIRNFVIAMKSVVSK